MIECPLFSVQKRDIKGDIENIVEIMSIKEKKIKNGKKENFSFLFSSISIQKNNVIKKPRILKKITFVNS